MMKSAHMKRVREQRLQAAPADATSAPDAEAKKPKKLKKEP